MAVRTTTFQIALIVIIIVGILIVIHASWTLAQLNRTVGTACACSGASDNDLNNLRTYSIIMLLVGIGILFYSVIMFLVPTSARRDEVSGSVRERFSRKTV